MEKLLSFIVLFHIVVCQNNLGCDSGYELLSGAKCVKVYYGMNELSWHSARDICMRYGSQLVTLKDQYDNDKLGEYVTNQTKKMDTSFWIGLSQSAEDSCSSCKQLKWENGFPATNNMGFWRDEQPDDELGDCVFSQKNMEDYVYDRPHAWSYDNCFVKRAFVCEKMAAPTGSFHCFNGGYVRNEDVCNEMSDCSDGSDELNCPQFCKFYYEDSSGFLNTSTAFQNAQTCTWVIITPPRTNAFVELTNFMTEKDTDFVTVSVGDIIDTKARRVARLSGNQSTVSYQSYNNMLVIKFSSDSFNVSNGFTARYNSTYPDQDARVFLIADTTPKTYSVEQDIGNLNSFVGTFDYVFVIETRDETPENPNDYLGKMITLEILNMMINDDEFIEVYDGATPYSPVLAKMCKTCGDSYKVLFSTGSKLSILYRRMTMLTMDLQFTFRYTEGCSYYTTDRWGTFFSPGYTAPMVNYPNFVNCIWKIEPKEPIAVYFDPDLSLRDGEDLPNNGDFLVMYFNDTRVHPANSGFNDSSRGFNTSELAGRTFKVPSGVLEVRFNTSAIQSSRGFKATWSIGCQDPQYDSFTMSSTGSIDFYYTAKMTLTCATGYAFQQEQIPVGTTAVNVECLYGGVWKDFLQIPRCTPAYCSDVPPIENGRVQSSTGSIYQDEAKYECFPGLSLQGPQVTTCQADGNWSATPTCQAALCPFDEITLNIPQGLGVVTNGNGSTVGSIIEYNCSAGFQIVGEPIIFCQANGTYTSTSVSCKRLTCQLPPIMYGSYDSLSAGEFVDYETVADVRCNTGFKFQNDSVQSVSCQSDRSLSQLPTCIDIDECASSPCDHTCNNTKGSFYCSCFDGYSLDGLNCVDIDECAQNISNCDQNCTNTPGSYNCSCNLPYVLFTPTMTSSFEIPFSETGSLPTDTFHYNHTCVLIECPTPPTIMNGMILDNQDHYRYGDCVEIQCNIGYIPRSTVLKCQEDGQWSAAPPNCTEATCPMDTFPNPSNPAAFANGPYKYEELVYLNCSKGTREYSQFRHCTYNPVTDVYELQGSPYDCGVIDCGPIESQFSNTVTNTLYPSQFLATCPVGDPLGSGPDGSTQNVFCSANGFWEYGDLRCQGETCTDPGYPAGGNIEVTSFAIGSVASFSCNKTGYSLLPSVTDLTCTGLTWNDTTPVDVNGCVDTEDPIFVGDCGITITVKKYELLEPRLPDITVTDNTGIEEITIFPVNANYSSLYVEANLTTTLIAYDFRRNSATCTINVQLADETPPPLQCPTTYQILLETEMDSETLPGDLGLVGLGEITIQFRTVSLKLNYNVTDLYKTFTYSANTSDEAGNTNACGGQVFVSVRPGCFELAYPTPMNANKSCQSTADGLECAITCEDRYTFQNRSPKTITVSCSNGVWDTDPIPACVLDTTKPVITCPASIVIELEVETDEETVNFNTVIQNDASYSESDLNTIPSRVPNLLERTFSGQDLYQTTQISVEVTDLAGNMATCDFQYTVLPKACSPLSLPTPINAKANNCTKRTGINPGYDCILECDDGYVLRGHGYQKPVSCNDGQSWDEMDIYPACILDTYPPEVECPKSQTLVLDRADSTISVTFGDPSSTFVGNATDVGVVASITYDPPSLSIDRNFVDQMARAILMKATDRRGNSKNCTFYVAVEAPVCSDLSIATPVNGNKSCIQNSSGSWTCQLGCDAGYSFVSTSETSISTTCNPGSGFDQYVPSCVAQNPDALFTTNILYWGILQYRYVPDTPGVLTVPESCIDDVYISQRINDLAVLDGMEFQLRGLCSSVKEVDTTNLMFNITSITGTRINDVSGNARIVVLDYNYTITGGNTSVYLDCAEAYDLSISANNANGYRLSNDINGDTTAACPKLIWDNFSNQTEVRLYCAPPYFEYQQDRNLCVFCPAGQTSNGVTCYPCPIGTYRMGNSIEGCVACPNEGSTRYPGATSEDMCFDKCTPGLISSTGFEPCYPCALGSYSYNTTYCQSCDTGFTTTFLGASSNDSCLNATVVLPAEPCSLGTESDGSGGCRLCDFGEFRASTTLQTSCAGCQGLTSTYIKGAVSQTSCTGLCGGGLISMTGRPPCTACPKGTYWINSTYCQPCADTFTTEGVGSTLPSQCQSETLYRVNCPKGTFRNASGDCVLCAMGTYQDQEEQGSCKSCGDKNTFVMGAISEDQCFESCYRGFRSDTGFSPCEPCGENNYWINSTTCMQCPNGAVTSTNVAGSIDECFKPCPPGYFSNNGYNITSTVNGACRQCPLRHYQENSQSTSCSRCPGDTFTNMTGITSRSLCQNSSVLCNCNNGGTCNLILNTAFCECPQGFYGPSCSGVVNHCNSDPCYNGGVCSSNSSRFTCDCQGRATGDRCENIIKTCDTSLNPTCRNGYCINRPGGPQCICKDGFSGERCDVETDICLSKPCNATGTVMNGCLDVSFGAKLRRNCTCKAGYEGEDCSIDTDDCASNPCINGGQCIDEVDSFRCECVNGYSGTYCENRPDRCLGVSCIGTCADYYKEESYHCACDPAYEYFFSSGDAYTQYSLQLSVPQTCTGQTVANPDECRMMCTSSATCNFFAYQPSSRSCCLLEMLDSSSSSEIYNVYTKMIVKTRDNFNTAPYNVEAPRNSNMNRDSETVTNLNTNYGLNICGGTEPLEAECCVVGGSCDNLPAGVSCTAEGVSCTSSACENLNFEVRFKCAVNRVFLNNQCRLKTDYCDSSPCINGGTCFIFDNDYRCNCEPGYTGLNCQTDINECASMPCQNSGTCTDEVNGYSCNCAPGYTGTQCDSKIDYCVNINCNQNGDCMSLETDYKCDCNPGYEGKDCENQTDLCLSQPCIHGRTCNPSLNDYTCDCEVGWMGKNCDQIIDYCNRSEGQMCNAECKPVFNDYYCECPSNTFGRNCENQPDPCQYYNKCQNGAQCGVEDDGEMTCECPIQYMGDGCQILVNHCGKTNKCDNGAQCTVTSNGYNCTCLAGYEGEDCEDEINECSGVQCLGDGNCFDAIGRYYCRCPLKKTGENCSRDYDTNYDLYFTSGYGWIPYFIQVLDVGSLSLSLWVRFSEMNGEGVYMTQYIGDELKTSVKFMELNERGIMIYGSDPNNRLGRLLELKREVVINDGNWHLITFTFNTVEGHMIFYVDTVFHDEYKNDAIVLNITSFRMWLVLGCEFDKTQQICKENGYFHGYISQINWYKRILNLNELTVVFDQPKHVYDPMEDVILVWNEYVPGNGVDRVIPSEAFGILCNVPTRPVPCRFFTIARLPTVSGCPSDIVVNGTSRLTDVTWTAPTFSGLGPGGRRLEPINQPDKAYLWGIYDVVYVGISENNYGVYCSFRVYVQESQCELPENPFGGPAPMCWDNNPVGRRGCTISCYDGYAIDRVTQDLFTCDASGTWNYDRMFDQFRFPACGEIKDATPKVNVVMNFVYNMGTTACIAVKQNLELLIRNTLATIIGTQYCNSTDCSDLQIDVRCGNETSRRKRQTLELSRITTVVVNLANGEPITTLGDDNVTIAELLTYQAIGNNAFNYPATISNAVVINDLFSITTTPVCGANQVILDNQCVECGPGNYFRYTDPSNTTAICDDCPKGSYQEMAGQANCTICPDGKTTEFSGTYESIGCKDSCRVGYYFDNDKDACTPCPLGFYQDETGQFRCKPCDAGFTTEFTGTNSSTRCTEFCDDGEQLDGSGNCEPCPIGQFRNASETVACELCETGKITPSTGAKTSTECNVTACEAGNRLNSTNQCEACPVGTFQDKKWQTNCTSCGDPDKYLTEQTGSSSPTDCKFYCPPGSQVVSGTETCEVCAVGTYKETQLGACLTCTGNFRTPGNGSISASNCTIYKCPVGFAPNATNNGCSPCPLGEYQDVEYSESCKKCSDGLSTRNIASNSSSDCEEFCPSGEEKVNGDCVECPLGSYKSNMDGLFSTCQPCRDNYTTATTGSKSADNCTIRACPMGTRRNENETACIDCPLGYYQPKMNQSVCLKCGNGTSTRQVKAISIDACEIYCDDGLEKNAQGGCDACQRGYYKDNDDGLFGLCQLCPIEYITQSTGATSLSECTIGNCTRGQRLLLNNTCEPCPKGFYQENKWMGFCMDCGPDKTTEFTGSDNASDCIFECKPGFEDAGGFCKECPIGFFKVENAATKCSPCPNNTITESIGANSSALCNLPACSIGTFLDRMTDPMNPVCKPCGYDTYQDEVWQYSCKPCLNGEVTLKTGASNSSDCVANCSSGQEYNSDTDSCKICPIGYFRDSSDRAQTSCQMCDPNFITRSSGSISISNCSIANCTTPGQFRNTTTNTCQPCPIGKFNSEKWVEMCQDCQDGFSTREVGAKTQSECIPTCPLGQVVGPANVCVNCSVGFYRESTLEDNCTKCPNNLLTPFAGSNSENDCSLSPCLAGNYYDLSNLECKICPVGTYQPSNGAFQCIQCENGYSYTAQEGSTLQTDCNSPCVTGRQFNNATRLCEFCPVGYYQDQANQFVCQICPDGLKFTEQVGSTSLSQCLSFCSNAANPCSSNASCETAANGAVCTCNTNFDDVGSVQGTDCVHKCDRGYCYNNAACILESLTCQCTEYYEGPRCQTSVRGDSLSDDTNDIIIGVSIGAGGLLLFLIILAVCCLCFRGHPRASAKQPTRYSEFKGDRVEKASSIHSYGQAPFSNGNNGRFMLAPYSDVTYDNEAYLTDTAVYTA